MKTLEEILQDKKETKDRNNMIGELKPREFDNSHKVVGGFESILSRFFNAIKNIVWRVKLEGDIEFRPEIIIPEIKPPKIPDIHIPEIKIPEIKVPEANVRVTFDKMPEIKVPDIKVPEVKVTIPPINIPDIKIPKAQVEVKIPDVRVTIPPIKVPKQEVIIRQAEAKRIVRIIKRRNDRGDVTEIQETYSDGTKSTLKGMNTDDMRVE